MTQAAGSLFHVKQQGGFKVAGLSRPDRLGDPARIVTWAHDDINEAQAGPCKRVVRRQWVACRQVPVPSRLRTPDDCLSRADKSPQAEDTLDAAKPRTSPPAVPGMA